MTVLHRTSPLDNWQVALRRSNKLGVIYAFEHLVFIYQVDRAQLMRIAEEGRVMGRSLSLDAKYQAFRKDPDGYLQRLENRRRAAKNAARSKAKAKRRSKAKEAA